uniref:Uncharacterized protein n=1 Tax=Chrysotila carterae TaxID=13221 RepID=A0A7S4B6R3_CHRCT
MRWLLQALFGRRRRAVVFLDVDGVLNSRATRENGDHDPHPALVAELARLVNECHAHVVLSSTWRLETKNFERVSGALQDGLTGPKANEAILKLAAQAKNVSA